MRILNIIQCTNLGGMEQASLRLMQGLNERGHSCKVLSLNRLGGLGPLLEETGIPAEGLEYRGRGGWMSLPVLRKSLRESSADALMMTGHNLLAMQVLGDLARGHRLLAMHYHHKGVKPAWQWRLVYETALRKFSAITFPSDFIRNEALAICPSIAAISHTVRNPLPIPEAPTPEQKREAKIELGLPADIKVVGNAGWLIERKRFDIFLRVAQQVVADQQEVLFVIAGDGEERKRLEALAENLGLSDKILWLGWQQNLSLFYRSLDVLLFNSDWDALGNTPLEAMSWGAPVVASVRNGGLSEVITGTEHGFLFKEHDIEAMADAICSILNGHRNSAGLNGRMRVAELCDTEKISRITENLLLQR